MQLEFTGEVWFWRGPSPFHFVTVPEEEAHALKSASALVTYGWAMIPVEARIGCALPRGSRWAPWSRCS
ncbi:MAG: DUF1905 domain-containing protein [Candidatus Nanopelagicales bacterium]